MEITLTFELPICLVRLVLLYSYISGQLVVPNLGCLNSSHKINMLSMLFCKIWKYILPQAAVSHEACLVGYICLRVDIYPYSAKKHKITGSIIHIYACSSTHVIHVIHV